MTIVLLTTEQVLELKLKNPVMGRPPPGYFYVADGSYNGPYASADEAPRYCGLLKERKNLV